MSALDELIAERDNAWAELVEFRAALEENRKMTVLACGRTGEARERAEAAEAPRVLTDEIVRTAAEAAYECQGMVLGEDRVPPIYEIEARAALLSTGLYVEPEGAAHGLADSPQNGADPAPESNFEERLGLLELWTGTVANTITLSQLKDRVNARGAA